MPPIGLEAYYYYCYIMPLPFSFGADAGSSRQLSEIQY